jgi:hypothetical protein
MDTDAGAQAAAAERAAAWRSSRAAGEGAAPLAAGSVHEYKRLQETA